MSAAPISAGPKLSSLRRQVGLATPLLLREPVFESVAPADSRDFQVRLGWPESGDVGAGENADNPTPCVLVVTRAVDQEIDELSVWLAAQGIALLRLDSDRCASTEFIWRPDNNTVCISGRWFRPVVCWLRYFDVESLLLAEGADDVSMAYARQQWWACAMALAGSAGALTVNATARPGFPDRVAQLAAAGRAGLRVPATVVTTRPAAALAVFPGGDVLVKTVGRHCVEVPAGQLRGVYPRRISRDALAAESRVEPAPVLVQEYIAAPRELRVYAVAGKFLGYGVTRPAPESVWTDPDSVRVCAVPLAAELEKALASLCQEFRLDVAAFDLLDTDDGPVFLEVNAECDWLWTDRAVGTSATSTAVRELISTLYRNPSGRLSW